MLGHCLISQHYFYMLQPEYLNKKFISSLCLTTLTILVKSHDVSLPMEVYSIYLNCQEINLTKYKFIIDQPRMIQSQHSIHINYSAKGFLYSDDLDKIEVDMV